MSVSHQDLPRSGEKRELLRQKGQFWTPTWVAEAMVAYALSNGSRQIFDPAVGEGAFLRAAKQLGREMETVIELRGTEIDAQILSEALSNGLSDADLEGVQIRDFILNTPQSPRDSIVANPPYIRHHRLSSETKAHLKNLGCRIIGKSLDGRAGLHIYFLLQSLELLAPGGRLAFIVPADTCEGIFSQPLWRWITRKYRLDGIVTFEAEATPFPSVDTNALVLLIAKEPPRDWFYWGKVKKSGSDALKNWVLSEMGIWQDENFSVEKRDLAEGLSTGFSRPPQNSYHDAQNGIPTGAAVLGDYVSVMRGIATGSNEFFFLTKSQVENFDLPAEFLRRAVGRTRDVSDSEITDDTLARLEEAERPTYLLNLDGRASRFFPPSVQNYLRLGEQLGLPQRALIMQRKPWYKMETRRPPQFLFAYLGRRNARFILNRAQVLPLTGFLCVYPKSTDSIFLEKLARVVCDPEVIANLPLVGKSYGSGAIKVEPRALERLALPRSVLNKFDLAPHQLFN